MESQYKPIVANPIAKLSEMKSKPMSANPIYLLKVIQINVATKASQFALNWLFLSQKTLMHMLPTCHNAMALPKILPPSTVVVSTIALSSCHQVVLCTHSLGWVGGESGGVVGWSSHLGLVGSYQDIGCDEESTIFCWRNHIVSLIPHSA